MSSPVCPRMDVANACASCPSTASQDDKLMKGRHLFASAHGGEHSAARRYASGRLERGHPGNATTATRCALTLARPAWRATSCRKNRARPMAGVATALPAPLPARETRHAKPCWRSCLPRRRENRVFGRICCRSCSPAAYNSPMCSNLDRRSVHRRLTKHQGELLMSNRIAVIRTSLTHAAEARPQAVLDNTGAPVAGEA